METAIEVLKVIGVMLLAFAGLITLVMLGIWQATWGMTPEEKDDFLNYIKENGILGHDDDYFP